MPLSPRMLDGIAVIYNERKAAFEEAKRELDEARDQLIDIVEKDGRTPARAVKTKALAGDEWEIRVSYPAEVTVDTGVALRMRALLAYCGCPRLFRRLFKSVETFTLADGAQKLIGAAKLPKYAPRNLRSLFARAIRVRELAPQLEVRERGKKTEAA